jgi:zinc transporter ZupT
MLLKTLVLFLTPLLSGLLIYFVPKGRSLTFKLVLVFAGSYLFSITVIHILPELYRQSVAVEYIGICVLGGFFLQQLLEYFTSGVEHGHIHIHEAHDHRPHSHDPSGKTISALVLLTALCIHAFLEGAMLVETENVSSDYDLNAILLGIVLHRTPAAFALMSVLSHQLGTREKAIPFLVGFSLAAPIGLFISTYLSQIEIISRTGMIILYAVVCGNFLHISTTIVFESSPEHHFSSRKLAVAILAALVAIGVEYII